MSARIDLLDYIRMSQNEFAEGIVESEAIHAVARSSSEDQVCTRSIHAFGQRYSKK